MLRKLLREIAARFSVFLPKRFATLGFLNRNRFISIQWRQRDSNSRPPACKAGALPTELSPHLIRQPPAFPYRLQYSIIGRLGLNHRVRDENGCVPQAHRHQKCSYFGFLHRRCALRITTSSLSFFLTCPWQINSNATPTSPISLERR